MQEETIHVDVRDEDADSLCSMLTAAGLRFTETGYGFKTFTISGTQEALAAFQPKLDAWQRDCESRAAW